MWPHEQVVHALGFRPVQSTARPHSPNAADGLVRRMSWLPRPFQAQWLALVEAALPGVPLLAPPPNDLFTLPIADYRERTG